GPQNYDLIVLADIAYWEPGVLKQLRDFMQKGGVVLVAFGKNLVEQFAPNGPATSEITRFFGGQVGEMIEKKGDTFAHLTPVDYSQSFLQVFEQGKRGNLGRIQFTKFAQFIPEDTRKETETLLWFDSKYPALVKRKVGEGALLLW